MIFQRQIYYIIIYFLLCLPINVIGALRFDAINVSDGMASNYIQQLAVDNDGFIWTCGSGGLCRYNGFHPLQFNNFPIDTNDKTGVPTLVNLHHDPQRRLLWMRSSSYTWFCYNLKSHELCYQCGTGFGNKTYQNMVTRGGAVWLYKGTNGARRIDPDHNFHTVDYTAEKGLLADNEVREIVPDANNGAYIFCKYGFTYVDSTGKATVRKLGRKVLQMSTVGDKIFIIGNDDRVTMTSRVKTGERTLHTPPTFCDIENVYGKVVRDNSLWLFTNKGTFAIDSRSGEIKDISNHDLAEMENIATLGGIDIVASYKGKVGIITAEGKVSVYQMIHVNHPIIVRRSVAACMSRGKIYIATDGGGLYVLDSNGSIIQHVTTPEIASNNLSDVKSDRHGNIWIASLGEGLIKMSRFVMPECRYVNLKGIDGGNCRIRAICADKESCLVADNDRGAYNIDVNKLNVTKRTENDYIITARLKDSKGRMWTGTYRDGLLLNGKKPSFTRGYDIRYVTAILEDRLHRIWISTLIDGLFCIQTNEHGTPLLTQWLIRNDNERVVQTIKIDNNSQLWIATNNGLYRIDTRHGSISEELFKNLTPNNSSLMGYEVCDIATKDDDLWFAIQGMGIAHYRFNMRNKTLRKIQSYTTQQGLPSNIVRSLTTDNIGNIWVGTEYGIAVIDRKSGCVRHYTPGNTPNKNHFIERCATRLANGTLLFGTNDGVLALNPAKMPVGGGAAERVIIDNIEVNGRSMLTDFTSKEMKEHRVSFVKERRITLPYNYTSVSLEFSAAGMTDKDGIHFQYYTDGIDETWRPITSVNRLNLEFPGPGTYTVSVKALVNGEWTKTENLEIVIRQPWWNTWWAWIIWGTLTATALAIVYRQWHRNIMLRQEMVVQREMTRFRLDFFTNIAHEFRTPLAIIQGAVDRLEQTDGAKHSHSALQTTRRGTKRLLRLVNQLLEFRKIETGKIRLHICERDIISLARDIYHDIRSVAEQKETTMTFTPFAKTYLMPIDAELVETIIYNLLSNAIKYTPTHGCIDFRITLSENRQTIILTVEDNGPGISAEREKHLFQPFMNGMSSQGGMGIGLYTTKQLAITHKGDVTYGRSSYATGCRFTVTLPANGDAYSPEDITHDNGSDKRALRNTGVEVIAKELMPKALNDMTVVIIEDDTDMMEMLKREVGVYFNVKGFMTGSDGLAGIRSEHPALVICDVMLPDTKGYEVVKEIKTDTALHDIPVVMLTALNDDEHQIKAYKAGADDYMTKPCNYKLLVVRCAQLIKYRKNDRKTTETSKAEDDKQQNKVHTVTTAPNNSKQKERTTKTDNIILSAADKQFIERMNAILTHHIADASFSLDTLAQGMNIGRTKLFGKSKELLGMTPNARLLQMRLEMAEDMLKKGKKTAAEISYLTGFSSPQYFNQCFKKHYGVSPNKYKETQEQQ